MKTTDETKNVSKFEMTTSGWLSVLIMGAGQIKNKQYIKGAIFFVIQFLFIFIEIMSSSVVIPAEPGEPEAWGYGFFRFGLWGLYTLGESTGGRYRDNSPMLLIQGLIAIILIGVLIFFWIYNIMDANRTAKKIKRTGQYETSRAYFARVSEDYFAYMIIGPALLLLLLITIMPILYAFLIAFTNYNTYNLPPANLVDWVGLQNFRKIIQLPGWRSTFFGVAVWTIVWAFLSTFTTFFGGLFVAIIINNKRVIGKRVWRTILILPWAIPQMISLLVFRNFFNQTYGPLNQMLGLDIPWLNDPFMARLTLIIVNFWLGVPYFMMLMSGLLTSFDKALYEAADVDGASEIQKFSKITLPIILLQSMPLLIMSFAHNFNNFGAVFFLTQGNPRNIEYEYAGHTDILISWIYKMTIDFKMYNMAAVMSFLIFLIIGGISTWNLLKTDAFKEDN